MRLKTRKEKTALFLLLLIVGIGLCVGLYYLMDTVWNGSFVDWFMGKYMYTENVYSPEIDSYMVINQPRWPEVKILCLVLLISVVVICLTVTFLTAHFYARKKMKKSITSVSEMLRDYMVGEKEAAEVFPKEYAEISAQMSEIKATIQRHEQTLKEETARKNDLITYLAHDLKTPLTSVIGYLSLLDEVPDMPSAQREKYVGITLEKARRLEMLINEFFEITRYNLQQIVLEKETIDLYYMLVQLADEFYPLLAEHGNTVKLAVDESMTVYADSLKLARVFNNILKNAISYSYPGTEIEIRAKALDTQVKISFINRGKTISRQKLNSVFEKFFRLDEARTANTGGAGLGLAIAKEIVTLHEGEITAQSEDEITVFCVCLPVKAS